MHKFGRRSSKQLSTCHDDLIVIMIESINRSKVDFGISEGHRSIERQHELFLMGRSKRDGYKKLSKHNSTPSEAVDIYIYHPNAATRRDLAYDKCHLTYVAGIIDAVAVEFYEKGITTHLIRWGANWDSDGIQQ